VREAIEEAGVRGNLMVKFYLHYLRLFYHFFCTLKVLRYIVCLSFNFTIRTAVY
jgi:8-oxo-dGTP pyrophosphatase MutT (NUDIX family)